MAKAGGNDNRADFNVVGNVEANLLNLVVWPVGWVDDAVIQVAVLWVVNIESSAQTIAVEVVVLFPEGILAVGSDNKTVAGHAQINIALETSVHVEDTGFSVCRVNGS